MDILSNLVDTIAAHLAMIAALLALVSALSYLFPQEGIRGAGRIVGGCAFVAVSLFFRLDVAVQSNAVAAIFFVSGLLTIYCGARKFARR